MYRRLGVNRGFDMCYFLQDRETILKSTFSNGILVFNIPRKIMGGYQCGGETDGLLLLLAIYK
jgi:hypothetical protein